MEQAGRQFLCGACRATVQVCRGCDRGQLYCTRACAEAARERAQREAGARYQRSRRGRFAHAARAQRYRARHKIVTHQGSAAAHPDALLLTEAAMSTAALRSSAPMVPTVAPRAVLPASLTPPMPSCCRCGRRCGPGVRLEFLRPRRRGQRQATNTTTTRRR